MNVPFSMEAVLPSVPTVKVHSNVAVTMVTDLLKTSYHAVVSSVLLAKKYKWDTQCKVVNLHIQCYNNVHRDNVNSLSCFIKRK